MFELVLGLLILAIDLCTKALAAHWLPTLTGSTFTVIEGVFSFTYVKNYGAAFGIMQDARWFFIVATVAVCAVIGYVLIHDYTKLHRLMRIALALILTGAVGNFVDRVMLGYVRDMLYFSLIDFPVFNVADSALTIGCAIMILDLLFGKGRKLLDDRQEKKTASADESESVDETNSETKADNRSEPDKAEAPHDDADVEKKDE